MLLCLVLQYRTGIYDFQNILGVMRSDAGDAYTQANKRVGYMITLSGYTFYHMFSLISTVFSSTSLQILFSSSTSKMDAFRQTSPSKLIFSSLTIGLVLG